MFVVPVSGNPSLVSPVDATGILIRISPPAGIALTSVNDRVRFHDWVDIA